MMKSSTPDILLHCCCAPCAVGCVERLLAEGRRVTLFFSNCNIAPVTEYERRLEAVRQLAAIYHLPLIEDVYDHAAWREAVRGLEKEPEKGARCPLCFGFSLARAAAAAEAHGIGGFTTSLTISPYKNSRVIFSVGRRFAGFEEYDFKKRDGTRRSAELTRQYGFYRQNYCGCEFSFRAESSTAYDTAPVPPTQIQSAGR